MIKRSNSETNSNTSFRANDGQDQKQIVDIKESFYKQKTTPERGKKNKIANSSFVDYVIQDLDNNKGIQDFLNSDVSEGGNDQKIKQKEQYPSRKREIRAESANSYNQNSREQIRIVNNNQWSVKAVGHFNNNQNQVSQSVEKKYQQNSSMNGKCVYKIFPNIQLKLPIISQNNNNINHTNQNIQNQNNSANINSSVRPYQLGYSIDQHYYPQHVVGHRQGIKTQQSPRGQASPFQNNNSSIHNQNTNNISNGYVAKKYIDKSYEEILGKVNTENSQVYKIKSKSITESNVNHIHQSASKQISGMVNQTEASDSSSQNTFFQQNFSNQKQSINSQNYKRKILLKLKSSQQTKNIQQNTQCSSNNVNQTASSIGIANNLNKQLDQQNQKFLKDRLMNYISCKFNQIDKNLNNKLSKDEIMQFFESYNGSPIHSYKDFENYLKSNYSMFLLELVQKQTEKPGFLNFREFKQLFQDFFVKCLQDLEKKNNLSSNQVQNTTNLKMNPDQHIQVTQKKREISSEQKNNYQSQFKLSDKRIFSAQKVRNEENEELLPLRKKENSFDNTGQKYFDQLNLLNQQKNIKLQQQAKQEQKLKYDLFSQQKKLNSNLENEGNQNNNLNQNQIQNHVNQQNVNSSSSNRIDQNSSATKQKNQSSNQKYYLGSSNATRISSQNQINNSSFSNSQSENDFQSPKKLYKIFQNHNKQRTSNDQSTQKSFSKQSESNTNANSEIEIDKTNINNETNIIFKTEQKVRSKSTFRNQSSQSSRKVSQNEKIQPSENSPNKQFRSNSQQSNYSFDSPVSNQLPQHHPKLQKSKFSNESSAQKPPNNRYQSQNDELEGSEQYVKFIELHQVPITADFNLKSQQNSVPVEQYKQQKQEVTQRPRSNSKSVHNQNNFPSNDSNRLRSFSKEIEPKKISPNETNEQISKPTKSNQNEIISSQENQQQSQPKNLKQKQNAEAQVEQKQKKLSGSSDLNQVAKEQKQQVANQDNTKSSSFTDKSINYISEVSNPRYYFSSSQQIHDDHADFKLAFEDQKLNKIGESQNLPSASNQKTAMVGMSGSLLLRQYNRCLKVNSPQKKATLTIHQSNPIIEQIEPSLTEPNEQSLTERQQNLEAVKILSPNPNKKKEFECTFRPQSLDKELKETMQLEILQNESQNQDTENQTNFHKFHKLASNHLKVQSFCTSPQNIVMETPQYLQLKIEDINKNQNNQIIENPKKSISIPIKANNKELTEDNNYSFTQHQFQKNQESEGPDVKIEPSQILKEAQEMNDQNIQKASFAILNIKEDLINLQKNSKSEKIQKSRINQDVNSKSQKEQTTKKQDNQFGDNKIQSMNQIQYQEDDTRKSSATKRQIKSTFSQQFNNSSSDKTQILNNHLDQNCQNFLHKKEVKVLKKPSMKKSSEIAIKQMQNEEFNQFQEQTEKQMKNEETAKFEDGQKILNDITFENNSQMINAENNRKSSIQQGDLKLFYNNNSLNNSQNL